MALKKYKHKEDVEVPSQGKPLGEQWETVLREVEEIKWRKKASTLARGNKDSDRLQRVNRMKGVSPVEERRKKIAGGMEQRGYNVQGAENEKD